MTRKNNCNQNCDQNGLKHPQIAAIMVPFPIQGHLNEILHLSRLIISYGIPVHFAGSTTHNLQAKVRIHGWNPESSNKIHFHDFKLPPFNTLQPNPNSSIKFPGHLQPLFNASIHLRQPVFHLLQELSTKFRRIVVIHDTLMASVVQDVKFIPNAEAYALHSVSAFTIFFHIWEMMMTTEKEKPFQIDYSDDYIPRKIPSIKGCFTPEFEDYIANEYRVLDFQSGRLYNTCRVLEGKYMELLEKLPMNSNKKLFAIGPFNPVEINIRSERHRCLKWLDKQKENSVIYISFGTTTSMSDEQVRELAIGLEKSDQKFIWVLRIADRANVFEENEARRVQIQLPEGYEERVKNRGIVVRDWAPQIEILGHPSTGGFMSHCGWNSCMESICMGVPIIAWPMHSDQPKNSVLITQVLKIAIIVLDWDKRHELVASTTIENVVKRLMISKEGQEIRERTDELGGMVRGSVSKGGLSRLEMDSFIAHITR